VAVDYRGNGLCSGTPSERGFLLDALALTDWAMNVAGIPASHIMICAQSLGTAVGISLVRHLAAQSPPISFSGTVLVASFSNVETLAETYRIRGIIPVLSPLSLFPQVLAFFNGFIESTWLSKDRIAEFIRRIEGEKNSKNYHTTLIHAQDDIEIPCVHIEVLY
jgi:abhydrolase domain-containing protein 12